MVTVPSFLVSITVCDPSGRFVVSVTVPVMLLVLVDVVEPSGFFTVLVVVPPLEFPPELPPEELPPEEPPPVAGMVSRTSSRPHTLHALYLLPLCVAVAAWSITQAPAVWAA